MAEKGLATTTPKVNAGLTSLVQQQHICANGNTELQRRILGVFHQT
jgi:hypothetical protein